MAAVLAAGLSGCGDAGAETQNAAQPDAAQTEATENDAQQEQTDEASEADSAGASGEKVSVVLATNWGEGDAKYDYFYPLFEQFQEAHKDTLDITLQTYSTEDYKTKIKTQTASGDLPDVFTYWGGGMMKDMVDAGLLLNVDDYFAVSSKVSKEQFEDGAFEYYVSGDGNAYGIPLESTRGIFIANKALFEQYSLEYPKTYEDLVEVSEVFKANDIIPLAIGSNGGTPSEFFFSELYNQYEGAADEIKALAAGGSFHTENAVKVAEVIVDMIDQGMLPADTMANGGWTGSLQLYTDQKAAMTYTYPWNFEFISDEMQENSEIIPIPQLPGSTVDPSTMISGFTVYGFVINKQSFEDPAKQDAVLALCDFLASDELTQELTKSGMIPCKKVEVNVEEQKPIMRKTIEYAKDKALVQVHYTTMPSADAITMMDSSLDELFIKAITPEEFAQKVQAVLDKNNES